MRRFNHPLWGNQENTGNDAKESRLWEKEQVLFRSGGSIGNTAKILGKLKQHPILIADLASDQIGDFLKKEMENHGVNMEYSYISDRGSYLCIAVLDADNERTMFVWIPPGPVWTGLQRNPFRRSYF